MAEEAAVFDDLRSFVAACQEIDPWHRIQGAHWDREIGAIIEATAELASGPPMLLFDHIPDYPPAAEVLSLALSSPRRVALAMGLPVDRPRLELVRLGARRLIEAQPVPPVAVERAAVMENVVRGPAVDLTRFPVPRFHGGDGGRYIGTRDSLINRDPESGYVNVGTYRMQLHEPDLLGLWMSPGQQGRQICQRYWDRHEACPVVAVFGSDPLTFLASHTKLPWGRSELDFLGGLRGGRPVEVVRGPLTGLPIPAHAEIAVEGEVPPPDVQARAEGPFGEWPGYYSGGTIGTGEDQPVIRVRALYHRDGALLHAQGPMWPGAACDGLPFDAGLLWEQLNRAGIQDVVGVYTHSAYLVVIAIRQRYAGHAKQVAHAALGCAAAARNGRYVVVVDDDIDPTDIREVLWAMQTRVDPATDIEPVDGCWSTPLDPRMPPHKREQRDHTNSRAIFYAVRPWPWRERYPRVSRTERAYREEVLERFRPALPFLER